MKNFFARIRKILFNPIPYNIILPVLCILFILLIFPLLYIGKWNVPSADDYACAYPVHEAILSGADLKGIFKAAVGNAVTMYKTWQGSFSNSMACSFHPTAFGVRYYAVVPYLMLSSLITGVFVFIIRFFGIFSAGKRYTVIIAIVILTGCTQFLPSPVQSFYWYSGAVYYTFFFGISLLLYSLLIAIARKKEQDKAVGKLITACLLCVIIGFSNYITALITAVLTASLIVLTALMKNRTWKLFLLPFAVYMVSFILNVTAPGNTNHINAYVTENGLLRSLNLSFAYGLMQIVKWNRVPVLALYLFLIPLLYKIAAETDIPFRFPGLVSLYSLCLFAAMFFPTFYAGSELAGRSENIRYFAMIILFVINIFYWLGWLHRHVPAIRGKVPGMNFLFIAVTAVLFIAGTLRIPSYRVTTYSAVQSYYLGQIGQYKHVFNKRLEILNDPEVTDAVLPEYPRKKPFVLYYDDISRFPMDWRNLGMSLYFHKNTVRLRGPED